MPRRRALPPRKRGLAILIGCAGCVLLNVATLRAWGESYFFLFPIAFALMPVGATLVVTGASTGGEGGPKLSPPAARLMIALVLVGLVSGVLLTFAVKR
jgi:hypothetical protein